MTRGTTPCQLCGGVGDVKVALVEWLEPVFPGRRFEAIPACVDRSACRGRYAGPWPLAETKASVATLPVTELDALLRDEPAAGPTSGIATTVDVSVPEWG